MTSQRSLMKLHASSRPYALMRSARATKGASWVRISPLTVRSSVCWSNGAGWKGARAQEVAAQLPRQLVLAGARRPAQLGDGGGQEVADEGFEPGAVAGPDDAIESAERGYQNRPHVAVALGLKARRQLEVLGHRREPGARGRPGVADEVEAVDRLEPVPGPGRRVA